MKIWSTIIIFIWWIYFSIPMLDGQDAGRQQKQTRLQQIRKEIDEYRQKIQAERQRELQLLDALDQSEREIDLTHQLVVELKNEQKKKGKLIEQITQDLDTKNIQLQRLQNLYAKRMVSFYKYGRMKDLELLLSSRSFNQKITWLRYQKLIANNDQRNYSDILKKKENIEAQRNNLKQEIIGQRKIINEKSDEERNIKSICDKRNKILTQVQENKEIYLKRINEYELSAKEIQRLITLAEDKKLTIENERLLQGTDFPSLKRRMIWPTDGTIVSRFGQYRHPRWKTITENIGIDIQTEFGADVRAVSRGIITAITWQRGRGNIIIINHGSGYFSVYTHLSQILVQIDDEVNAGQVIGNVGESGSLQGPILHFEIWKNNDVLNPEEWLG